MPELSKLRVAVVAASKAAENALCCPVCQHDEVTIEGKWQRGFRKQFCQGEEQGAAMDEAHIERYTAIECSKCGVRSEIERDDIVDMINDNMQMRMELAQFRGMTVQSETTTGKPQVM